MVETKTFFLVGLLVTGIILFSGCIGSDDDGVEVVGGVEFRILGAEYEAGKIVVTLSSNVSVENARIDIVDEADQLLCTRYKDLAAGVTVIEMTGCGAGGRITVSVSPPGGGIVTREFTLVIPSPGVEIVSAEYGLGAELVLKLDANMGVENTSVAVSGGRGAVLCTEYFDLSVGLNEIRLRGCGAETKITVSVMPPEGVMSTDEFTLKLPLLELREGFRYVYAATSCPGCSERDLFIYVTKETGGHWEGIAGIKMDESKKAYLMRWVIDRDDLGLSVTLPLTEDAVLGDVNYVDDIEQMQEIGDAGVSMMPFWMILLKGMYGFDLNELVTAHKTTLAVDRQNVSFSTSDPAVYGNYLAYTLDIEAYQGDIQTDTGVFIISAAKPYLLMETDMGGGSQISFRGVELREFSFDDYEGYSIEGWASS